jgi:stage III sporulation protein AF
VYLMEGLKTLIRNLALILLLATFLEMLLPSKAMRGFIQLVMGLFVIAAILNPLVNFFKLEFVNKVPAWVTVSPSEMPVLAAEGDPSQVGKSAVKEQYKRILTNQLVLLVSAIDGVKDVEVDVELENTEEFSDYPQILKVTIIFSSQNRTVTPINPVIIGANDTMENIFPDSDKSKEIKNHISALMQIRKEILIVKEKI